VWEKIKSYVCGFIISIIVIGSIFFFTGKGAGDKLSADLRATKWNLESSLRTIDESAKIIRGLQSELIVSGKLTTEQQSIINRQQLTIDNQKQIIDGIINTIGSQGSILGNEIRDIAKEYRQLYNSYH
jgi:hypothetical protein